MYLDKLDGRISASFFDAKAAEFRAEQSRIMRDIEAHQTANQSYIEEGIQLLELVQRAAGAVRKSARRRETQTPEFCTFELRLEGGRVDREVPATL